MHKSPDDLIPIGQDAVCRPGEARAPQMLLDVVATDHVRAMPAHDIGDRLNGARLEPIIGFHEPHVLPTRRFNERVARGSDAAIVHMAQQPHLIGVGFAIALCDCPPPSGEKSSQTTTSTPASA